MFEKAVDRGVEGHGVALVADSDNFGRIKPCLAEGLGDGIKARIAVAVLLVNHRDRLGLHAADSQKILNDSRRLLRVTGTVIEDVAIRRIASQESGARE